MNNMETFAQKKRRVFGRVLRLPKYLEELSKLLGRKVEPTELLSIVQTDEFIYKNTDVNFFVVKECFSDSICICGKSYLLFSEEKFKWLS
ncbi:hypothetical protein [Bacteroides sp.]